MLFVLIVRPQGLLQRRSTNKEMPMSTVETRYEHVVLEWRASVPLIM